MRNKIIAILSAALLCFGGMCGITAYANYDSTATAPAATATPKPARTISTEGAGHVVDNISDSDKLQFISVTAKDGSVFFIVIDKQNVNDNVYFLNKVDISDLEALAKGNSSTMPAAVKATPAPSAQASPSVEPSGKTETAPKSEKSKSGNSNMFLLLIALAAIGGLGLYYFKIYIPKKKMENAPDLEDFEFAADEDEDTENEDDTYIEDETEDDI
ncbi:MAG: DUF4366 domain-containing protein [Clostridia bacterium]|nr:DUF4366 domain-containing protein [Clostridia bacterium]